ncbi:spinster family MFS transporter [Flavisphingomonas formosensis]|uniref:spinster family MFS transporter n=1 Tax=Flavisphingomonas formosensis TaxID=861534 RepID=UPI0012FC2914|nr:MFS transporter [Sphingomonas formosensis]
METRATSITARQANAALFVLLLTYMMSYIDRTALGVLQEPIKRELALSDWQLGLLSGPVFAVLYALMSLPIARLAERYSRSRLIALCLFFWSLMTMVCGLCQSYAQLLVARIGVSIGEAGGNPASHSLIADLFPPSRRGRAISVYTFGVPVGAFLGAALSGWLAAQWGWRAAFLILGPAGFLLVLAVLRLIPNVPRGRFDEAPADPDPPDVWTVLRTLGASAVFRRFAGGAALVVLVGYGAAAFVAPFLIRVHRLDLGEVGLISGLINGAAAGAGTLFGGFAADHFAQRDRRHYGWMPAVTMAIAAPCFTAGFLVGQLWLATALLMLGTACLYTYIAPTFAQVHAIAGPRMRATAAAVLFLIINLIGLGLGPPIIGSVSDYVAANSFDGAAPARFAALCKDMADSGCHEAAAAGITAGMLSLCPLLPVSALLFWLAGKAVGRDGDIDSSKA